MKNILITLIIACSFCSCETLMKDDTSSSDQSEVHVVVLGIAQDAGYPQAGCTKSCCQKYYSGKLSKRMTSCIGIIDRTSNTYWMVDATPDFKEQLQFLSSSYPGYDFGGVFLTHAHVGHYTGLIHLGREIMGANQVPVYAMPRMTDFLTNNGPWSQLVQLNNIDLIPIQSDSAVVLNDQLSIIPMQVPHRDEYSETVGYKVMGPRSSLLFIPDIDKWDKWDRNIKTEIQNTDIALLDGSFYQNGEIPGRDMSLIPHPFMEESLELFSDMDLSHRMKINFIHFNHTNPVLDPNSEAYAEVIQRGLSISSEGQLFPL